MRKLRLSKSPTKSWWNKEYEKTCYLKILEMLQRLKGSVSLYALSMDHPSVGWKQTSFPRVCYSPCVFPVPPAPPRPPSWDHFQSCPGERWATPGGLAAASTATRLHVPAHPQLFKMTHTGLGTEYPKGRRNKLATEWSWVSAYFCAVHINKGYTGEFCRRSQGSRENT